MKHLLLTTIAAVLLVGCGKPSIHEAARTGNIEAVKQHIAAGADVNAKDEAGWTLLHEVGTKEVAELLIAEGADVNAKNDWGWTPLTYAAINDHEEIAELLIAKGADVNAKDDGGETPLDWAIYYHHPETTDLLRKHGGKTGDELKAVDKPTAPVAEAAQPEPTTAKAPDISIHKAATLGNIEAVKQHLAAGADVNAKDKYGRTPLHLAAVSGHKEVAELLIANGADVNAKDIFRSTALHRAAYRGHKEIVELLIAKGADVNAEGDNGITPLDLAIGLIANRLKHPEIADLLRQHGGKTGEELKAAEPVAEAVKPTIPPKAVSANKGTDPARGIKPEPPTAKAPDISIHKAAKEGNIEAVKQHIAAGTDVNEKDDFFGRTPLYDSAMRGQKEVAELLIANGADVKAKDIDGWTPLRKAAYYGHKEIVELLIANGADVNAKDDEGRTPLDEAAGEIADLLRKHGGKTGEELKAEGK